MPAMPTAAGTRAAWARGAATHSWSFLTKNLAGGLFWHFTRRGGLIRQKFINLMGLPAKGQEFHPVNSMRTSTLYADLKDKNTSRISFASLLEKLNQMGLHALCCMQ
jgi:hypothetical protein